MLQEGVFWWFLSTDSPNRKPKRATAMALTLSERLRVQSVASALQAGIGCAESARKRKKPVKTAIATARLPHPGTLVGRKLPSALCVYSAALLLLFR